MRIQGQTVTLREMEKSDVANKVKWFNDPEVNKTLFLDEKLDLQKSLEWFNKSRSDTSRRDFVIETSDGRPIGNISLVHISDIHKTAEIFIAVGQKKFWGKGVMYEAEGLLIQWAFDFLKLEKIRADAYLNNIASIITMKKLGFQTEGTLRKERYQDGLRLDVIRFGLLKEEFLFSSKI
ncbi:MAG: GNAT family N-acetyltransferase [Sedimentisphaerales bacterium]|nr:GNAT family N-acetyltransferase [Sedimentisphaerales bacterium]